MMHDVERVKNMGVKGRADGPSSVRPNGSQMVRARLFGKLSEESMEVEILKRPAKAGLWTVTGLWKTHKKVTGRSLLPVEGFPQPLGKPGTAIGQLKQWGWVFHTPHSQTTTAI